MNPMASLNIHWNLFTAIFGVILISVLVFSVIKLRSNRALAEKLCYYLLMFVLIYKTAHYVLYCAVLGHDWTHQIPCEISQITYFFCPIAFLTQQKYIKESGAFMGIFAGFVQLIACIVSPMSFVNSGTLTLFSFVETIFMHYIVLWAGLIQVTCIFKLEVKKAWQVYLSVLLIILWGVLASFTWRFGTDAGYPDEPANIGFVQRCVLPEPIIEKFPWLAQNHLFILPYLVAFFAFTVVVYLISSWSMKTVKEQEPSIYGIGCIKLHKILKEHSVK